MGHSLFLHRLRMVFALPPVFASRDAALVLGDCETASEFPTAMVYSDRVATCGDHGSVVFKAYDCDRHLRCRRAYRVSDVSTAARAFGIVQVNQTNKYVERGTYGNVADFVIEALDERLEVLSIAGLSRSGETVNHIELALVTSNDLLTRARLRYGALIIDLIVGDVASLSYALKKGTLTRYSARFSATEHLFGDSTITNGLREIARSVNASPPLDEATIFRVQCQPFDLLRKLESAAVNSPHRFSLALSALIQSSVDAFFARHRLQPESNDVIDAIAAHSSSASAALERVLEIGSRSDPEALAAIREMVTALAGAESDEKEIWMTPHAFRSRQDAFAAFQVGIQAASRGTERTRVASAIASYNVYGQQKKR